MQNQIRPIYSEIQGYLSQIPKVELGHEQVQGELAVALVKQLDTCIDELEQLTQKDYSRFREVARSGTTNPRFDRLDYRMKLAGLISRLHGEYFSDESAPFSGMPNTVINQSQAQSQNQTVHIQLLLDFQSSIDDRIAKADDGSNEKNFLLKIKSFLSQARNVTDLVTLVLKTGKEMGITLENILKIFS